FRRTADGSAFQLVESSVNVADHVGEPVFAYEYHPGHRWSEEPEGLDWWDRDNVPDSRYPGQLHAILLDNDAGDDKIWLKHYRVDYWCMFASDILWRNVSAGEFTEWLMANGQVGAVIWLYTEPAEWQVQGIGDFNGDGTSDILWRNVNTGEFTEWLMANGQV